MTSSKKRGLLPEVLHAGYDVRELRLVDRQGRRAGGFELDLLRATTRFKSLPRSALSAILYGSVAGPIETYSATRSRGSIPSRTACARASSPARRFDLVIGADGLHSTVRRLVFGPERQFERSLGYTVAASEACGYRPRDENVYIGHS